MPTERMFLVERYLPEAEQGGLAALGRRLAAAAAELRGEGLSIEWLESVALPGDEACLCLFRAADERSVAEANRRAAAEFERISPALVAREL
jgi:hypothetical protein